MSDSELRKNKPQVIPPQWKRREKIEIITGYKNASNEEKQEIYKKIIKLFYWI